MCNVRVAEVGTHIFSWSVHYKLRCVIVWVQIVRHKSKKRTDGPFGDNGYERDQNKIKKNYGG